MQVKEALERIRFNTSTLDDLSGKAINRLFTNKNIIQQLLYALDKYALETLGIEAVHSLPLGTNVNVIPMPDLALRTQAYKLMLCYISGQKYMIDIPTLSTAQTMFRYQFSGVPRWLVPWEKGLTLFPATTSSTYNTTTLSSPVSKTDTTIYVEDTSNFLTNQGRITIGDEKIVYEYSDATTFYGCVRGVEDTVPSSHLVGAEVDENNLQIWYYKKNFRIPVLDNDIIDSYWLDKQLDVCDEHMEIITDYTSFKLLSKIDPSRGNFYKVNFEEWLAETKAQLAMGRSKIKNGGDIRMPYWWEGSDPYVYTV